MLAADKENSVLPTPSKLVMDENWDKTTVEKLKEEPLLIPNEKRFVMFPIEYDQIWHAYKSTEARFWSAEEIELSDDINDWQELPQKEKALVLQILTLFVTNDSIIGTDIVKRFSMEIQAPEARSFFGFLMMQNNIHLELFNVIFEMYDKDHDTDVLFDTIDQMPSTSKKSAWIASKLVESTAHYSTRLVSLAVYYRIFFAGSIALLMHFTKNTDKLFPGLVHSVGKMSRDYAKYADFCLLLIRHFQNKHSAQDAKSLVVDAVRMEFESVQQILANSAGVAPSLVGVDIVLMDLKGYLENMGNSLLVQMGHQKVFNVVGEPLNWVTASLDRIARLDDIEAGLGVSNSNSQVNKNATNSSVAPEFSLDEDF